jgi:hypothetical protein
VHLKWLAMNSVRESGKTEQQKLTAIRARG